MQNRRTAGILAVLILFLLALVLPKTVDANSLEELSLKLETGYRVDELDWNHAGPNDTPNILSELQWTDLKAFQIMAKGKMTIKPVDIPFSLAARGHFGYGWIFDGDNQDSDYNGNNRTLEFSRSNNNSDDGNLLDSVIGGGLTFPLATMSLQITPLIGWSYHEQNLTITEGWQTVSVPPDQTQPLGPIAGLDSTFDAKWYGPWIGVDLEFKPNQKWNYLCSLELHWATFESDANWNLRTDLKHPKSMEQYAEDGLGLVFALGANYAFSELLSIHLDLSYQKWEVEDGTHTFNLSSGARVTYRLNEVNWESYSAMLGIKFSFYIKDP